MDEGEEVKEKEGNESRLMSIFFNAKRVIALLPNLRYVKLL